MRILFSILSILWFTSLFASKIEESYFVYSTSSALKKSITQNPQLILDHVSKKGFELYGPRGLGQYLKSINVKFVNLESLESIHKKSNSFSYPRYDQVVNRLKNVVSRNSKIMQMFSVGKTVEGRDSLLS